MTVFFSFLALISDMAQEASQKWLSDLIWIVSQLIYLKVKSYDKKSESR